MARSLQSLRFTCQPGCIRCCDRPGYVYLTETNLHEMAAHLGMTVDDFEQRYVRRYKHFLRLRSRVGCHFLTPDGCSVHPVKPLQCRTYPYWPSITADATTWRDERQNCPGIGKGELIQIETVRRDCAELESELPTVAF